MSRGTEKSNELVNTGRTVMTDGASHSSDLFFYLHKQQAMAGLLKESSHNTSLDTQPLDNVWNRAAKRAIDIVVSLLVIVLVLTWLIPLMAILIKLSSPGPVFFVQKRNKRNDEIFTCIKFRSMVVNQEAHLLPATENDPRITKIGRFLRRYYIDELPQFLNVLVGDMSVVGPRPHMISDNLRYGELVGHYFYRHKVKPGITGLAQVLGYVGNVDGNPQKLRDRVHLDIYYWRHWSHKLDFIILIRTIGRTLGL